MRLSPSLETLALGSASFGWTTAFCSLVVACRREGVDLFHVASVALWGGEL
jgi:hypothetical protein